MRFVTVPGIGGSDPSHWQSLWEAELGASRFAPTSWDEPDADDWRAALDRELTEPTILVAHSLGCLTAVSVIAQGGRAVAGAFLVAVPDQAGPQFPAVAEGFQTSQHPLRVPAVVVASTDDPYGSVPFVRGLAASWQAQLVEVGPRGHLNSESRLGAWREGRDLLDNLVKQVTG